MKSRLLLALCAIVLVLTGQGYSSGLELPSSWPWDQTHVDEHDATLTVVRQRSTVPGYDRSCKAGHACVFGPAWTDDVDVRDGRNGCDQRSDVLRESLEQIQLKPGTNGCIVASGILRDPYTNKPFVGFYVTKRVGGFLADSNAIKLFKFSA